jgi:hypothetical protein
MMTVLMQKGFEGKTPKPLVMFFKTAYFFAGNCSGCVVGEFGAATGAFNDFSNWSLYCESLLADPPFVTTLIANAKTIKVIANAQVPFSKKSPVFCTPINCDELEKFDDKPPPLGFCINTMIPKSIHTIITMIDNTKYISLY